MSSAQNNDNGEGSSASAATVATVAIVAPPPTLAPPLAPAPPPVLVPLAGEAYLQSLPWLPRLIMAILGIPAELARISQRLRNLPIQRQLSFNQFKDPKTKLVVFNPRDNTHIGTVKPHYNVTALLVFVTGNKLEDGEACCGVKNCMTGIFSECIVPAEDDDPQMTSKRACANCQYDGMGSKCPRERQANDDDDDEMDVDDEYMEDAEDEDDEEYEEEEEEEESMFVDQDN